MPYVTKAAARLIESANWFDSMSDFQKREYIKEHPDSKYAHDWHPSPEETEDVEVEHDEFEPIRVETLGSKVRAFLVKALGGEPNRVFKNKKGYLSKAFFDRPDGSQREVNLKYSGDMLKSGKKFSPYGYWKDADTYVYLSKRDYKSLSKEQLRSLEDRQRAYGIGSDDGVEDSGESKVSKKSNLKAPSGVAKKARPGLPAKKSAPQLPAPTPEQKPKPGPSLNDRVKQQTQQMARPPKRIDFDTPAKKGRK